MRISPAMALVGLLAPAMCRADLLPPGTRNIPVEHRIETAKEYPEWVFFVVRGSGGVTKVTLKPKTPIVIPGSSAVGRGPVRRPGEKEKGLAVPYRASAVVAVPKDKVNEYKTEKELHAAIEDARITGAVVVGSVFFDHVNAKATDPRKSIGERYRLTQLDAKRGATLEPIKSDGPKDEPKKDEEELSPTASAGMFPWIATGFALAAAASLTGFFLLGRSRRRELGNR